MDGSVTGSSTGWSDSRYALSHFRTRLISFALLNVRLVDFQFLFNRSISLEINPGPPKASK